MRLARGLQRLSTRTATKHSGVASLLLRTAHAKAASTANRALTGFALHHHSVKAPLVKASFAAGIRYFQNGVGSSTKTPESTRIAQLVKQLETTASDLKWTLEIALYPNKKGLALLYMTIDSIQDLKDTHTIENLLNQLAAVNEFLKELNDPSKRDQLNTLVQLVEKHKTSAPLLYDLVVPFIRKIEEENLTSDFKM